MNPDQHVYGEHIFSGDIIMKTKVTEDCIACGRCVEICPDVFEMGDEYAEVKVDVVPPEHEDAVRESADECPTDAIIVEE